MTLTATDVFPVVGLFRNRFILKVAFGLFTIGFFAWYAKKIIRFDYIRYHLMNTFVAPLMGVSQSNSLYLHTCNIQETLQKARGMQ
jgi:hypothetical protein